MASEHILRIPRNDDVEGGYVLINVTSNGKFPLDLKLLATEGEEPYRAEIKQSRISNLRDKRNVLSDDEWAATLRSALGQRQASQPGLKAENAEKLETIATITGETLAIILRYNISGITQKLGEILFRKDENQEIDMTSWASTAVQRSIELQIEVQDLSVKHEEQSKTIQKLNEQLEDLIQAKKMHEDALLEKFRELLNAKKLKIRDQQRLLAGAKVDSKLAAKNWGATEASKGHTPAASRRGKRKANGKVKEVASESEEEDSFERKPDTQRRESESEEQIDTPEESNQDVTEDESDDDLGAAPRDTDLTDKIEGGKVEAMQVDTPLPARELPFGKTSIGGGREQVKPKETEKPSTVNQKAGNEDEETDDDDEL